MLLFCFYGFIINGFIIIDADDNAMGAATAVAAVNAGAAAMLVAAPAPKAVVAAGTAAIPIIKFLDVLLLYILNQAM